MPAGPAGLFVRCLGAIFLATDLLFGIRDAWVSIRGPNGSVASGLVIAAILMIPMLSVVSCVAVSRSQYREQASTRLRAGIVAIAVGLPVALRSMVGATY